MPETLSPAATVTLSLPGIEGIGSVSDAALAGLLEQWADARRVVDSGIARLSGEVERRSRLDLGYDGLAQRTGDRTPEAFVSRVTRTSGPEARELVAVGTMLA